MGKLLWPTSRGWIFLIGILIWFAVALVNRVLFAVFLGWICIFSVLLCAMLTLWSRRGWMLRRGHCERRVAGQKCREEFRLCNLSRWSRLPVAVCEERSYASQSFQGIWVTGMGAHEERTLTMEFVPVHRGEFAQKGLRLVTGDPLGLFRTIRVYEEKGTVVVYPAEEPWASNAAETPEEAVGGRAGKKAPSPGDFRGLREYAQGDSLKSIDWKATLRHNRVLVREFEKVPAVSFLIRLDSPVDEKNAVQLERWETAIRQAAGVLQFCRTHGWQIALYAGGRQAIECPFGGGEAGYERIAYELAILEPGEFSAPSPAAVPMGTICLHLPEEEVG